MKKIRLLASIFRPRLFLAFALCVAGAFMVLATFGYNFGILAFGGTDINLITGTETSPRVTQSTSAVWAHGDTIVAAYTDTSGVGLSPQSYCGVSTSTDNGNSFTRLAENFNTGGACYGAPSVFYSVRAGKWFLSNQSARCGSLGVAQWTSPNGIDWTNGTCPVTGTAADFQFGWVDNNPASPFYGRQYYAFNDFNVSGGAVRFTYSTDDGATWTSPISIFPSFRRVVKITGSFGTDGTIFIQTMDEGGGGLNSLRQNYIYRSTNGGANWSSAISQGAAFLGPGRANCSSNYFVCMYSSPIFWRHMGWGQPGVGPGGVVHYAYSGRPSTSGDPGNIYYVRSTDNGMTWSAPVQLNTDTTTRAQWGASLSVNAAGKLVVSWYDERNTTNDSLERFARVSGDNGASWEADMSLSDVIFPRPLQSDPNIIPDYAGYYDHAAFASDGYGDVAFHAWTDGRVAIKGAPQQDVFIDKIDLAPAQFIVTTTDDHDDGTCGASDCTLREALHAANAQLDSIITFASGVTGVIQLSSALPNVTKGLSLRGPGANLLTVRRNTGGNYRIFTIGNGTAIGPRVEVSGLTVANGQAASGAFPSGSGGGIINDHGYLTVSNCTLSGNSSDPGGFTYGGGIFNHEGTLTIQGSTFIGNNAYYGGGAANNLTTAGGRAFLFVTASTFTGNSASGGYGGAFWNAAIGSSTNATLTLSNCTLAANSAASGFGGALYNSGANSGVGSLTLTNCTLSDNSASSGGGLYNFTNGTAITIPATLRNSIFKTGAGGANLATNTGGSIISQGHNLSNDAAGGDGGTTPGGFLNATGDIRNTDPQLDPAGLADNGGETRTIALLAGSPAINAGDDVLAPARDQRGYLRTGVSDIGAFEFNGAPPAPPAASGAVSRKIHGGTPFDINLPLTGSSGIECRTGGPTNDYQIVFTFPSSVTFTNAAVTAGAGSVSGSSGSGTTTVTVNLTGITNAQNVTVTLLSVNNGTSTGDVGVTMGVLIGDTNGDGFVNAGDALQTRNRSGQATDATNFRSDVNIDGLLNSGDTTVVRARSGTSLP